MNNLFVKSNTKLQYDFKLTTRLFEPKKNQVILKRKEKRNEKITFIFVY